MRPMLAPAENVVLGFDRLTTFGRLKNSERNCSRIPSRRGKGKFLNSPKLRPTELGPNSALRPVLPYTPAAGITNAVRSNHCRIRAPRGRSPGRSGSRSTSGLWLGVPLRARSEPSRRLIGKPVRIEPLPLTCHPFTAPRTSGFVTAVRGNSQIHENEPICLAEKSDSPYCVRKLNTFGTAAPSDIADAISCDRENV